MSYSIMEWFAGGGDPLNSTQGSFLSGLGNSFTGNLDYNRQKELQQMSQVYSALEAQKSRVSRAFVKHVLSARCR